MRTDVEAIGNGPKLPDVYLINVGVNTSQYSRARSPIFTEVRSGRPQFLYVPFYSVKPGTAVCKYPTGCVPYLNPKHKVEICHRAHADPDWENLTYGDNCEMELRGRALRLALRGDILLFWGLLCDNTNGQWDGFAGERGWYLIGALRIEETLSAASRFNDLSRDIVTRARKNIHFNRQPYLAQDNYVFVGNVKYSALFLRPVNLEVILENKGLIYKIFRSATGQQLQRHGQPSWSSSLRSCRKVLDLHEPDQLQRAKQLQKAIIQEAGFDIFKDVTLP